MNDSTFAYGQLRLLRTLYEQITADLARLHPFAYERVGFLYTRRGTGVNGAPLVLAFDYIPVADQHYEISDDLEVGASIGVGAVRTVMQHIYDVGCGAWHVHLHDHRGRPHLSTVDRRSLPPLIQAFDQAVPGQLHGALLLSRDYATATTWPADRNQGIALASVSIVGYPLTIYRST